jgi:hypothetical protein
MSRATRENELMDPAGRKEVIRRLLALRNNIYPVRVCKRDNLTSYGCRAHSVLVIPVDAVNLVAYCLLVEGMNRRLEVEVQRRRDDLLQ